MPAEYLYPAPRTENMRPMKVEIIRCEDCDVEAEDDKGYAVARAMLTDISQIEAQYVGLKKDSLDGWTDDGRVCGMMTIGSTGVSGGRDCRMRLRRNWRATSAAYGFALFDVKHGVRYVIVAQMAVMLSPRYRAFEWRHDSDQVRRRVTDVAVAGLFMLPDLVPELCASYGFERCSRCSRTACA